MFAYCPQCTKSWTNEEFVKSYLVNAIKVPGLTAFPDTRVRRLKAMAVKYQMDLARNIDPIIIDAAYNLHIHTKSCFKCLAVPGKIPKTGINSKKRKCTATIEGDCRYREPHRKKHKTIVQNASEHPIKWFAWDGSYNERFIKEICLQQHQYDAFQNVCCPAVSHSKLTCNSNIAALMPGPIGQYTFKYNLKDTQKDDQEVYDRVSTVARKAMNSV